MPYKNSNNNIHIYKRVRKSIHKDKYDFLETQIPLAKKNEPSFLSDRR